MKTMLLCGACLLIFQTFSARAQQNTLPIDRWQRHVVDADKGGKSSFIKIVDLDNDGLADLTTRTWWYKNPGSLSSTWSKHAIGAPLENVIAVCDFDRDQRMDIVGTIALMAEDHLVWARNNGNGEFTIKNNIKPFSVNYVQGVAFGPFNKKDRIQFAVSGHGKTGGGPNHVWLVTVPVDPVASQWQAEIIHSQNDNTKEIDAGDIDDDGDLDIVIGGMSLTSGVNWLRNDGGGNWTLVKVAGPVEDYNHRIRLVDLNNDGKLDIVNGWYYRNYSSWYEQPEAPGRLWPEHFIAAFGSKALSIGIADMDHDRDLDIIVGEHRGEKGLYVVENRLNSEKSKGWRKHLVYQGDDHHQAAVPFDIDEDGDTDIISIGWDDSGVIVYENRGRN